MDIHGKVRQGEFRLIQRSPSFGSALNVASFYASKSLVSALSSSSELEVGLSFGSRVRASSTLSRCRSRILGVMDEVVDGSDRTQGI